MRQIVRIAALMMCTAALAGNLKAQKKTLTIAGRVTAAGPVDGVVGANVYINDLSVSALTDATGKYTLSYTLTATDSSPVLRRLFARSDTAVMTRVRVRAVGYAPQVQTARLVQGDTALVNFELTPEPVTRELPTGVERARVPFAVARGEQLTTASIPGNDDALARFLFSPELVMQHQDALGLSESQRKGIQSAIHETQTAVLRVQWELSYEGEKLKKLLSAEGLDETLILTVVDRVLGMERDIKRAHMTLLVRIRNTLHPTQQAKLRELAK